VAAGPLPAVGMQKKGLAGWASDWKSAQSKLGEGKTFSIIKNLLYFQTYLIQM
jgi:hypothetical protein